MLFLGISSYVLFVHIYSVNFTTAVSEFLFFGDHLRYFLR